MTASNVRRNAESSAPFSAAAPVAEGAALPGSPAATPGVSVRRRSLLIVERTATRAPAPASQSLRKRVSKRGALSSTSTAGSRGATTSASTVS